MRDTAIGMLPTRRGMLGTLGLIGVSTSALNLPREARAADACRIGPSPAHVKGPPVFMNYDQFELDAAYDQQVYEPNDYQVAQRLASISTEMRARIGNPRRESYGPSEVEKLDIYRTNREKAPVFVFIHGGAWLHGSAAQYGYPAEMLTKAGAHYVAIDFAAISDVGGSLEAMADQARRAVAWVYKNAEGFGGDPRQLYVAGHSSGGHLCAMVLVTDWQKDFGVPADVIKGGLCMSAMYDMKPVRASSRRSYVTFTDAIEEATSPQRHIDRLRAPVTMTFGGFETPEFQRQSKDFATSLKAAGKAATLIEVPNYAHMEMVESLGNPYFGNGRIALALMGLA